MGRGTFTITGFLRLVVEGNNVPSSQTTKMIMMSRLVCTFVPSFHGGNVGNVGNMVNNKSSRRILKSSIEQPKGRSTPPPDYSQVDSNPFNKQFTKIFYSKLIQQLPTSSISAKQKNIQYEDVIQVIRLLFKYYKRQPEQLSEASQRVIKSLFPAFIPPLFVMLFSKPTPKLAAHLNAQVTVLVTQWLMGHSKIADDDRSVVEIERCRYLEQTGCVAICLHSCKQPTEQFFKNNMGIPVSVEPNLDDYSCKFCFGKVPLSVEKDDVYVQPCFVDCPSSSVKVTKESCHTKLGKK